ncbi:MAG: M1 family metallopeptidase, partial [Acidimicrobiia bacterium]|nr:M1 family metallopeptidase [Acidimicrobiia bacterium]
ATDARRVLPCWDEPDFKATFQTTMVVPSDLETFTNTTEVARITLDDGRVEVEFATTMKMSTYLLAFVVGAFEATEPVLVRDTPIRIIVPKGNVHLTDVAMENAIFAFEYLTDYYGIPYPGDKLDHIGIPDFAAGAMENVGLITYRDAYLVIDNDKASQGELQNSIDVIGHETAHMWFGDLVTMKWWEGAWLNEAFASFMDIKTTAAKKPEWKRWLTFANGEVPWAMATDQLASTRPIEFEVNSPDEVDAMFDAITYGKGSAVLRMIELFMGEENFRTGVGNYLRKHAYANTVTTDLWEGLDGASEWPIGEIMDTWVYQRGFPQVDVEKVEGGVKLRQRRFLAIPDETDTTIWSVPMLLRGVADGSEFRCEFLLTEDEAVVPIDGDIELLIANAGSGFYRTRYSRDLFASLLGHLTALDDLERYELVSDTWALVKSAQVPSSSFLDLVGAYGEETEQQIWSIVTGGLAALDHHAVSEATRPAFQAFVSKLVGPALDRLGWDPQPGESDLTRKLRGNLIAVMGNVAEDATVVGRARSVVADLLADKDIDPEIATAALAVYAHSGDVEEYDTLWEAYKAASLPLTKNRYLRAVATVPTDEMAKRSVDRIINGDIRTQDGFWVLAGLLSGKGGPAAWETARTNWSALLEKMPGMTRRRVVEGIPALSQPEVAADVKAFFAETPLPEAASALEQNLEQLDANVRLRERETDVIDSYFGN